MTRLIFRLMERWAEVCIVSTVLQKAEVCIVSTVLQKARCENFAFKTQNTKFVRHSTEILKEGELYQGVCT